jgi:STE24 endopeptidase
LNEDKSARYHRLRRRADVASLVWSAAVVGALAAGAGPWLRDLIAGLLRLLPLPAPILPWITLTLFVVTLSAALEIGHFPLAFYRGYVLEHRYGLSVEAPRAWIRQHVKGLALGFVLGLGVAGVVMWTMGRWPAWWWLAAAAVLSAGSVLLAQLAPVALLPLFYRFEPLSREALRARLMDLAGRAGGGVVGVYIWHLGARTRKANAALVGFRPTRRILLSDTLLSDFSDDEIEVILAHELAHHVHHDLWTAVAFETGLLLTSLLVSAKVLERVGPSQGIGADAAALPVLMLVGGVVSLMLAPVANTISRSHERRADLYALNLTGKPEAFESAMRRLGALNLAEERPSATTRFLFYTHPPLPERIQEARAWRPVASQGVYLSHWRDQQ